MRVLFLLVFVAAAGAQGPAAAQAAPPPATGAQRPDGRNTEVSPQSVGMSAAGLAGVDSLIQAALADGVSPGLAVAIGRHGRLVRLRGYGRTDWDPLSPGVTDSTLYDLASLTKVIGTATATAQLVRDERLRLDTPVHAYLPFWPAIGPWGEITIRHLLSHTSGLPVGSDLWPLPGPREEHLRSLADLPVRTRPGTTRNYSDVGMILLGAVLEQVSGMRLDDLLYVRVFRPLGMNHTRFNPLVGQPDAGSFRLAQIAPTERDTYVRRTLVHGVAHDLNAWALGGVAGHAGLFSSVRDVATFAQALLDSVRTAATPLVPGQRPFDRPLGWDEPGGPSSSAGAWFTSASIGHTGYTGTSIWIDPVRDVYVVLLTNRLNPTAANQRHVQLRRELHDAVQLAITDMPVTRRQ
ncbi:MAG: serine hydrolase domain-containing protein [Gemmatimonadota bacterium]